MLVNGNVRPVPGDWPVGGAARQAIKLSQALLAQGVDTHIVTHRPRRRFPSSEVVEQVPVRYINSLYWRLRFRGGRRLETMLRLGALLAYLIRHRREYEVIHIHSGAAIAALAGVLAGRWLNKPTILKITSSGSRWNDFHRFRDELGLPAAERVSRLLCSATRVVTLNDQAAQELAAEGFEPGQVVHIPNGVQVAAIPPKARYDAAAQPNIVYIGRLYSSKGLDILLQALAQLPPDLAWRLALVGSGAARDSLVQLTKTLGLEERVTFAGEVADVLPYLELADIFVLPSRAEGISNSLLEAMSAGIPCIATDNAGNRRVMTHDETGMLTPVGDVAALADAVASLLVDAQLRERLGRAARQFVETHFDIALVADTYLALYKQLTGDSSQTLEDRPLFSYPLAQEQ
jgi:glycosyltransferase involved in cell wall biosynthesis